MYDLQKAFVRYLQKGCVRVLTERVRVLTQALCKSLTERVRRLTEGLCQILTEREEGLHKTCVRYLQNAKKAYTRLV